MWESQYFSVPKQDTLDSIFRGTTQQVLSLPQNRERWLNNYTRAVVENNRNKKATSVKRELKTIIILH